VSHKGLSREGGVIYEDVFEKRSFVCDPPYFFGLKFLGLILEP